MDFNKLKQGTKLLEFSPYKNGVHRVYFLFVTKYYGLNNRFYGSIVCSKTKLGNKRFKKTNVAKNHDYTYDRMEMAPTLKTDFTGEWGVFQIYKYYDVSKCEGSRKIRGTEAALSDHYPVWCMFYIDRDTN